MKSLLLSMIMTLACFVAVNGQESGDKPSVTPVWTENDRKYLLDNLTRSRQELIDETKDLTKAQWNFKEIQSVDLVFIKKS